MYIRRTLAAALAAAQCLVLAACVTSPVPIASTFNAAEIGWFSQPGSNTITGSAVMRTVGGDAKTCAATPVELVPDSTYARERMQALYGSTQAGYNPLFMGRRIDGIDAAYAAASRQAHCDALGQFRFTSVPDGTYYVLAQVSWTVPGRYVPEGGYVMRQVTVQGGEEAQIVLTPAAR